MHLCHSIMVEWGGCRRELSYKQGLFNHLLQGEYLVIVLALDSGNSYGNCRFHCTCYWLLEEKVYSLRINYDFLEMGNYFKKLICVCEPGRVVKTKKSGYCCSCFSFGNIETKRIYWLGKSYAIDKFLQGYLDARSFFIACVARELVDGTGKAFGFC